MIPQETLRDIAQKLLVKSRANQVVWRQEATIEELPKSPFGWKSVNSGYVLNLPRSQVKLAFWTSPTAPDRVSFKVAEKDGTVVGTLRADEGDEDWELLSNLYFEADRTFTGWDKVIDDIEKAVNADGPIGQR